VWVWWALVSLGCIYFLFVQSRFVKFILGGGLGVGSLFLLCMGPSVLKVYVRAVSVGAASGRYVNPGGSYVKVRLGSRICVAFLLVL
jgi:hypothetical protein